jgi:hypothetical protein
MLHYVATHFRGFFVQLSKQSHDVERWGTFCLVWDVLWRDLNIIAKMTLIEGNVVYEGEGRRTLYNVGLLWSGILWEGDIL